MLYRDITRYQHVERLGKVEVNGLLDGEVYVQEKLDGANATVAMVDGSVVLCSRNRFPSHDHHNQETSQITPQTPYDP